jgi:hypothetical protein
MHRSSGSSQSSNDPASAAHHHKRVYARLPRYGVARARDALLLQDMNLSGLAGDQLMGDMPDHRRFAMKAKTTTIAAAASAPALGQPGQARW